MAWCGGERGGADSTGAAGAEGREDGLGGFIDARDIRGAGDMAAVTVAGGSHQRRVALYFLPVSTMLPGMDIRIVYCEG